MKLRPNATFNGFINSSIEISDAGIIVFDPTSPEAARLFLERNQSDVMIFPLPIGDMWSWWNFAEHLIDKIEMREDLKLELPDFKQFLFDMGRIRILEDNDIYQVSKNSYLGLQESMVAEHSEKILSVVSNLTDDESRRIYTQLLSGSPEESWVHYCNRVFRSVQYFELIDYQKCQVVINGGVFEGFEIPYFACLLPDEAVIHNIDPLGYDFLTAYARSWMEIAPQRFIENRFALAMKEGELTFSAYDDGQVQQQDIIDSDSPRYRTYPAKSLDNFVMECELDRVDLIKFDLEGGDSDAVRGSFETIRRFRPQLALSIYHLTQDFWEIPQAIMNICDNYHFHIRQYSFERWETVFYAIPKEPST